MDRTIKMTEEEEMQNAIELVDYYRICFAHPSVKGIIMWGFWENANWIPASSMYRSDWSITPTGEAYQKLIFDEWWTKASGKANRKGLYSTSAFYGKYKITAGGVTKIVDFNKASGPMTVDFTKDTPENNLNATISKQIIMDNFKTTGVQHIGIPTNDMDATIDFYQRLGFEIAFETVIKAEDCRVCFFKLGNLCIEAYENRQATMKYGAIDHIAIDTTDIEAAFAFAKQGGFKLLTEEIQSIAEFWANGVKFFIIEGPNREKIEFCQKI
jgi:catechol 2,3-dioxygenase-like lactoylglutathione lyase family enzyme